VVLALVGLGFQGYVGWQYWGTTWVSRGKQDQIVEQLERNWAALPADPPRRPGGHRNPADADDDDDADGVGAAVQVSGTTAGAILRIPGFGSSYAVPILEGTSSDVLSLGVGHFPDSVGPGEVGNYALAAHRVTHGEPLRDMPELRPGDEVVVETRTEVLTYVLDTDPEDLVVTFEDVWVIAPEPRNPDPAGVGPADHPRLITLTTCAELFHTDERMIAFGHLVKTETKGA
jgi:sortase A